MSKKNKINARKACLHKFNPPVPPGGSQPARLCETNPICRTATRLTSQLCETNPKRIARRRRASTYITPRFHRQGTPHHGVPSHRPKYVEAKRISRREFTRRRRAHGGQNETPSDRTLEFIRRRRTTGVHPMVNPHFQCGMPPTTRKMQNEPNLAPQPPGPRPKTRNEPKFHHAGYPKNAKRTQFAYTTCPTTPDFVETNPIPNHQYIIYNIHYGISRREFTRRRRARGGYNPLAQS